MCHGDVCMCVYFVDIWKKRCSKANNVQKTVTGGISYWKIEFEEKKNCGYTCEFTSFRLFTKSFRQESWKDILY